MIWTFRTMMWLCLPLLMLAGPWVMRTEAAGHGGPVHVRQQEAIDSVHTPEPAQAAVKKSACDPAAERLRAQMRKLWIDHGYWARTSLVSSIAGLEDSEPVLARLLKNQQDIGDAVKPYYGEEAGNKLAELLREHILIAGKLKEAVQKGHREDADKYKTDWYRNAEDIATFLSKANPAWSFTELKALLDRHLDLVAENLNARLNKDWQADIRVFDEGEDHLIRLADVLAEGIVKQFPQ
ncbi:glycosyltransferase [Paenibacillus macerans]|uniref:glycosyltransferase n=1 Tax=Paenibacillus macerans TaxID=44252 RepID=UPI003D32210D